MLIRKSSQRQRRCCIRIAFGRIDFYQCALDNAFDRQYKRCVVHRIFEHLVAGRRFNGFIVAPNALLAVGQQGDPAAPASFIAAIDPATGKDLWCEELPAPPVKGGVAIDRNGTIAVSTTQGQIHCYAAAP